MSVVALTVPVDPRNVEVIAEVSAKDPLLTAVVCTLVDLGDVDVMPVLLRFLRKDPEGLRHWAAQLAT